MTIRITGVDALHKKLGSAAANATLRRPMQASVQVLKSRIAYYPPQRPPANPKRRYIRGYGMEGGKATSENLGKSWTSKVQATIQGLLGVVGNDTTYGPWVQSEQFQARIHRNYWQTDRDVIQGETARIVRFFKQAIDRALS